MSEFTAMLRLGLLTLVTLRRALLVYGILVIANAFLWGLEILTPVTAMVGVMVAAMLFSPQASRLNLLFGSLPLRRRTVMVSHYAVVVGATIAAVGLTCAVGAAAALVQGEPVGDPLVDAVSTCGGVFLVLSVMLPAYVRWGTVAALWIGLPGVLLFFGLFALVSEMGLPADVEGSFADAAGWLPWAMPALSLVVLAASCALATRIYERQDL